MDIKLEYTDIREFESTMAHPIQRLYPDKKIYSKFSYKEQKKVANLVIGNLLCMGLFILTTVFMFAIKSPISAFLLLLTSLAFIISSILVKTGKVFQGSWLATVGYLLGTGVITFFVQTDISIHVGYRVFGFAIVMAILNAMISLKPLQIIVFYIVIQVFQIVAVFTVEAPLLPENLSSIIEVVVICGLGSLVGTLSLYYTNKLNDNIIKHSEKEHEEAQGSLEKITTVLSKTQESLNIGQKLNEAAKSASESSSKINDLYSLLMKESEALTVQTSNAKSASEEVNNQAEKIDLSIKSQNNALSNTSAAMTEISANISNINVIAGKRREGMENVAKIIKEQSVSINSLVAGVEKLRESSKKISDFVKTVDSIAGQTSLLAMNASIEAAHAGNMGKGFSVIALEIRKLSEETTKNANLIAETLKENAAVVQNTIEQVQGFARSNEGSSEEIFSSVSAMEEILRGISEMDAGTKDVMHSLQDVVDMAHENGDMITNVVNQIASQDESFSGITNSTNVVKNRVEEISSILESINATVNVIQLSAKQNEEVAEKIEDLLVCRIEK